MRRTQPAFPNPPVPIVVDGIPVHKRNYLNYRQYTEHPSRAIQTATYYSLASRSILWHFGRAAGLSPGGDPLEPSITHNPLFSSRIRALGRSPEAPGNPAQFRYDCLLRLRSDYNSGLARLLEKAIPPS